MVKFVSQSILSGGNLKQYLSHIKTFFSSILLTEQTNAHTINKSLQATGKVIAGTPAKQSRRHRLTLQSTREITMAKKKDKKKDKKKKCDKKKCSSKKECKTKDVKKGKKKDKKKKDKKE